MSKLVETVFVHLNDRRRRDHGISTLLTLIDEPVLSLNLDQDGIQGEKSAFKILREF